MIKINISYKVLTNYFENEEGDIFLLHSSKL